MADPSKWNEWSYGNSTLDFHGYYRIGYGWDRDGEAMPAFQAPGSLAKYRLGNEDFQGGEIVIDYRYWLDGVPRLGGPENSRFIQLQGRWEDFESIQNLDELYLEFDNDHTKEMFIRFGNFLGDGTHAWFGRRFYDRKDIHMIDHFWLNVAQGSDYGGGIEGIKLDGDKTLDIAAFYAYDESVEQETGDNIDSYMFDVRMRNLMIVPDGKLTLIGQVGYRPEYEASATGVDPDPQDEFGFGFGAYHELANVMGGRMNTGFMFRQGAALVQNDFNSRAPTEDQGYDLSEAFSVEFNNDLVIEPNEDWSLQWASVARYEDFGAADPTAGLGESILWLSTGIRPVYYLTDNFNIAFESGIDWIDNDRLGVSGHVWKNTIALQLQKQRGYFERPVIRAFATYASWDDDLKGEVGGINFDDDTSGIVYGIQLESWW
ncbi:MAG: carbohydrate porin [Hyphomicrobiales bacterium]|nr:carbohydrate porin [Hyphomicrobiales bacterium]